MSDLPFSAVPAGTQVVSIPPFVVFLVDHYPVVITVTNAKMGEPTGIPSRINGPHWAQSFSGLGQDMFDERSAMKVMNVATESRPMVRRCAMVVAAGLRRRTGAPGQT